MVKFSRGGFMEEEIENVIIERITNRQEKLNEEILKEIGEILGKIGNLTPSEAYTIGQQLKYGESLDKIVALISKYSNINEAEIYKMLENEAKTNLAFSEKYFKAKSIDFIPYEQNIPLQNKVREIAIATINEYRNISRTTGLTFLDNANNRLTKPIREAYYEIVDNAINDVAMGKETFFEGLKRQLKTIGRSGVQSIEYESGYHRRIDSALRMNLQDGLNALSIAQQEIVGEQFDNDGWEITVHENPAPDHKDLQGHIFNKEEFAKLQDYNYIGQIKDINGRIYERTGEEHIRPIGELNCYHQAFAIVLGVDEPRYSQKELDKINEQNEKGFDFEGKHYTMYEGSQLQRKIETQLRSLREEEQTLKSSKRNITDKDGKKNIEEAILSNKNKQQQFILKYHELSKISGLKTKLERTRQLVK